MNTSSEIVKDIVLVLLQKDAQFNSSQTTPLFWNQFVIHLAQYETDSKFVYDSIYSLELNNPALLITALPKIYTKFIKELAENYVLGETSEATNYLLKSNNETFSKEISFLQTMQLAITSLERKQIKENLPKSYERLTFEISENNIALAAKMKSREDLKAKMKEWDKINIIDELKKDNQTLPKAAAIPAFVIFNKKIVLSKLLIIQFLKYFIITATIGITGTVIYKSKFKKKESKINPTEVSTSIKSKIIDTSFVKTNDSIIEKEEEYQNMVIDSSQIEKEEEKEVKNAKHSGMNIKKEYKVIYNNIQPKINGLFTYLSESEEEISKNKKYKEEYNKLLNKLNKYVFIGKSLTIYKEVQSNIAIILTDNDGALYFYDGKNYYGITKTEIPLELNIIKDSEIIEELNIMIEYGT